MVQWTAEKDQIVSDPQRTTRSPLDVVFNSHKLLDPQWPLQVLRHQVVSSTLEVPLSRNRRGSVYTT